MLPIFLVFDIAVFAVALTSESCTHLCDFDTKYKKHTKHKGILRNIHALCLLIHL
jgi:hypothetical protein